MLPYAIVRGTSAGLAACSPPISFHLTAPAVGPNTSFFVMVHRNYKTQVPILFIFQEEPGILALESHIAIS
jgi:hypothetical protein